MTVPSALTLQPYILDSRIHSHLFLVQRGWLQFAFVRSSLVRQGPHGRDLRRSTRSCTYARKVTLCGSRHATMRLPVASAAINVDHCSRTSSDLAISDLAMRDAGEVVLTSNSTVMVRHSGSNGTTLYCLGSVITGIAPFSTASHRRLDPTTRHTCTTQDCDYSPCILSLASPEHMISLVGGITTKPAHAHARVSPRM